MKVSTGDTDSPAKIEDMKSIISVVMGVLLALGVGLLVVFGIGWPLFMTFFDAELPRNTVLAGIFLVFAVAFSFYWGGMIASYRAPSKPRVHGTLVAPVAFTISPLLNVSTGKGLFPGLNSSWAVGGLLGVLAISIVAAYVGARRGELVFAHNQRHAQRRKKRKPRPRRERESRQGQEE